MKFYQTKSRRLPGSNYKELREHALKIYKQIEQQTKRRPYIRSAYFKKEKIFFDYFWDHLWQKKARDRMKRLPYFLVAIELIKYSRIKPSSKLNPNVKNEILHRFAGITKDKRIFYVQIKENKKGKKYFMSCFSPE
jgi:hypothetical protein